MIQKITLKAFKLAAILLFCSTTLSYSQNPPFDESPDAKPPYYRVRYDASTNPGELIYPVSYSVWIPPGVRTLRGVIVHQHGCGPWSCQTGLAGAYDLHWQSLAKKHECALLSASYEQPQGAECALWCDPRNGSDHRFQKSLEDLAKISGHSELSSVPWALWGHSGGAAWVGFMTMLHPERVAAVWLNSGLPVIESNHERPGMKAIDIPDEAFRIPMMCNLGTEEGVTVKEGRHAGRWPSTEKFFNRVRGNGGLIGVAVDPLTGHPTGNQRYLAIPWFDACLDARLPVSHEDPLRPMPEDEAWYAPLLGTKASSGSQFTGDKTRAIWLPNETVAKAWEHYVRDTEIPDSSPPPAPFDLKISGGHLTWNAEADPESGIAYFIIERNGQEIATLPGEPGNPLSRAVFQGMRNSDTPLLPLREMYFYDTLSIPGRTHKYRVFSVNTAGLKSKASETAIKNQPNIVVLLADDMGWGDAGTYGHDLIQTPNMDRLAAEGVKLTQCYSACGVCSPSRSAILTGRTPYRNGVYRHLSGNHEAHLRAGEITYPELVKEIGYEACHVGKWHLLSKQQFNNPDYPQPGDQGFDYWMYTHNNASPSHKNPDNFVRNGVPVGETEGYSAQLVAGEAAHWLKNIRDPEKPFVLSVWFHEPHSPIATDPRFEKLYDGHENSKYMGNITQLDHALGMVLDALDDAGVSENTLVFFTSDNGPVPAYGGTSGGLRGNKRSEYEGGIRVPGLARWPGHIQAGSTSDIPVIGTDVFSTVLDLVGLPLPADRTIDGVSMIPALSGIPVERKIPMFWRTHVSPPDQRVAMRIGDWKIVGDETLTNFKLWADIEAEGPREWWENDKQPPRRGGVLSY